MTSGVYELKFSNGDRYIGKSIDIENRWKQHMDKFRKGTAARAMQTAYDDYGAPDGDILCTCHSDHIDILEACYIARHKPELNSDRPKDPFQGISEEVLNNMLQNTNIFDASTWQHLEVISKLTKEVSSLRSEVSELVHLNDVLLVKRSEEELACDAGRYINSLLSNIRERSDSISNLECQIKRVTKELEYERLSWWKKLFS